jgi:hypothetical protein
MTSGLRISALFLLTSAATLAVSAQGTRLWTQSRMEEFARGSADGVTVTSDGELKAGPALTSRLTTPSTTVWSVAADKAGTAYLGTGAPATVLRVLPDDKQQPLLTSHELTVQVVRLGPDGALYAATLPAGRVYRLNPAATAAQDEAQAELVFDLAAQDEKKDSKTAHYIWDMTFDAQGRLLIATGGPASIWRVDLKTNPKHPRAARFFASDEQHIRALAWDAKGNLLAGSDGSGLVYRVSAEGAGYVLFEAPRREITALAVAADGAIFASSVGDKSRNPLPQLPVQGAGSASITIVQVGSAQAANTSASIPEGSEIFAIKEGQAPRRIWSGKDEIVYALCAAPDGLIAVTGNRGHVLRIAPDGRWADLGHLPAQQGLSIAEAPEGYLIGTGNTGKLVSLGAAIRHEYASDVLDAGAMARFGRVELDPTAAHAEILTRSGNVEQPVRGWTGWQPLVDGRVASPAGRYLQWKAVLAADGRLGSVGVNYLPINAAPVVDEIVVATGARWTPQPVQPGQQTVPIAFSEKNSTTVNFDAGSNAPLQAQKDRTGVTVRWAAHDDNNDELTCAIYLRGDGESLWRLLKADLTDKAYSFDASLVPDGGYQVRVIASDAPSHTPADALTAEKISERFELDTTPPVVTALRAEALDASHNYRIRFEAEDAASPLARAEYSIDAGPWQYIEPIGSLSDSKKETYEFKVEFPAPQTSAEHLVSVRVYDRHENAGLAKTVIPARKK